MKEVEIPELPEMDNKKFDEHRPFIVRGFLKGMKCQNWDIDYLMEKCGDNMVNVKF